MRVSGVRRSCARLSVIVRMPVISASLWSSISLKTREQLAERVDVQALGRARGHLPAHDAGAAVAARPSIRSIT